MTSSIDESNYPRIVIAPLAGKSSAFKKYADNTEGPFIEMPADAFGDRELLTVEEAWKWLEVGNGGSVPCTAAVPCMWCKVQSLLRFLK